MIRAFGLDFEFSREDLLNDVDRHIRDGIPGYVCALDGTNVAYSIEDDVYRGILNNAIVNNTDSNWVTMMVNRIYGTRYEHYCSSDMFVDILTKKRYRQLYLGSSKEVLDSLKIQLSTKYDPAIMKMPFEELPFCSLDEFDYKGIAEMINVYSPDIVWVSLGAPKQEIFMARLLPYLDRGVMFGVGAIFNFFSNLKVVEKRAPKWVIKIRLEWLFRLLTHPGKQFSRCWKIATILPKAYRIEKRKHKT